MVVKAAEKKIGKLRRLAAITKAYLRIESIPELDKIARIYLRALIDMVGCDACAIILIDAEKAKILAERGLSKTFGTLEFNTEMPTMKRILNTKKAFSTGDIQSSPVADYVRHGSSINSLICAPIAINKEARGIIYLDSTKKRAFDKEDIEFIELLSKDISIACKQSFKSRKTGYLIPRDELTECFNRKQFDLNIVTEIASAKTYQEQLSLLLVDVDRFQKCNALHGHSKGDRLLKRVADILSSTTRAYHRIYRYGEDEFAILMADTEKDKALLVGRRLQKTIEQEQFVDEKRSEPDERITVSIGVATFPLDADNAGELTEAVDLALQKAKEPRKNQVHGFSNEE